MNHPQWHYINYPLAFESGYPTTTESGKSLSELDPESLPYVFFRNIDELNHKDSPDNERAIPLAWLFHLVGDIHRPLHTTTSSGLGSQDGKLIISTQEETAQDVSLAPYKDNQRLNAVKALFVKLGASADDISIEKLSGVDNLVIRKPGKSQGTIVIGAHCKETLF